jgi:single-strand DNA-binding protein
MAGVNKVILIGNLGRDPELRYTKNGQAVANFSLATTESWLKDGNKEERTEWHRIVAWGKTAELCTKYLAKGRSVYIEGQLRTSEWEDKEGHKRQTTEVHAQTVQFLGSPGGDRRPAGAPGSPGESGPPSEGPPSGGEDIPF